MLREKAAGDLERVFKGASKTREKLGVSLLLRGSHWQSLTLRKDYVSLALCGPVSPSTGEGRGEPCRCRACYGLS